MLIKDTIKTEFKTHPVKERWTDKIQELLGAVALKACLQRNATKIQAILSRQHHIHALRSRKLDKQPEELQECNSQRVKTN